MFQRLLAIGLLTLAWSPAAYAQIDIAPSGTLRAAYLASNPAQVSRNAQTGDLRGVSYDLAQRLAKATGKRLDLKPLPSPPAVVDAVAKGEADIGFVAYEATRLGTVEFSQTYMLVQQTFLVLDASTIRSTKDIDRAGQKIAGMKSDSMMLCLKRTLKRALPVELDNNPELIGKAIANGEIDALGASRQRLTALMRSVPGTRLLADTLFNVPQNIIVPKGKTEVLAFVDAFIDAQRTSGLLGASVANGSTVGVEAAPRSPGSQHGCPE